MTPRQAVVKVHRWLSLAAAVFWLVQALTGIFAVYHWEIDDAFVRGPHRATDFRAIERSVAGLKVSSIWTSAGFADRYDVNLEDRVHRIDGAGNVLRVRRDGERWANGGYNATIVTLHHDLLQGDRGRTIVGITGILLISNILLGLMAAWPGAGQWLRALRPRGGAYGWHRASGLWLALPLLLIAFAGIMLAFEARSEAMLHAAIDAPEETSKAARTIGMAEAIDRARARYRDAVVSGIRFPSNANAVWRLTLRQRHEPRRAYGKTVVFVSAIDGRILADYDALTAPAGRRVFESLFALHTGEMFGTAGRIVSLVSGVGLTALMTFGVALWLRRR